MAKKGSIPWNKGMKGEYHLWRESPHPMLGKESCFKGKSHTEENKLKQGERMLGNKIWLGKKHTLITKEKIRQKAIGRVTSKETKEKMSLSHLAKSGGKTKLKLGYIKVLSKNHPNKDTHNYVFEHRLVMEKHLGRYLTMGEVVHHINEIRNDNRIENLKLFKDTGSHKKFHLKKNREDLIRLKIENADLTKAIDLLTRKKREIRK